MHSQTQAGRTHLFMVRLWLERLSEGEGHTEIRGEVRHVLSGRRRYVRDWPMLTAFLAECLSERDSSQINPQSNEPDDAGSK